MKCLVNLTSFFAIAFPAVPQIVQIKASTNSLEISWNAMESKVIYYKLLVKQGEKTILDRTIKKVPYKLDDLEAGETYIVHLSVCIEKKCESRSVEFRTISKAGGRNLNVMHTSSISYKYNQTLT